MSLNFYIDSLLEEVKPVVTGKHHFDYRYKSILIAFSGVLDYEYSDADINERIF